MLYLLRFSSIQPLLDLLDKVLHRTIIYHKCCIAQVVPFSATFGAWEASGLSHPSCEVTPSAALLVQVVVYVRTTFLGNFKAD